MEDACDHAALLRRARESARTPAACLAPATETLEGVARAGGGREDGHPEEPPPPPLDRGLPLGEASQLGGVHESPPLECTVTGAGLSAGAVWCRSSRRSDRISPSFSDVAATDGRTGVGPKVWCSNRRTFLLARALQQRHAPSSARRLEKRRATRQSALQGTAASRGAGCWRRGTRSDTRNMATEGWSAGTHAAQRLCNAKGPVASISKHVHAHVHLPSSGPGRHGRDWSVGTEWCVNGGSVTTGLTTWCEGRAVG